MSDLRNQALIKRINRARIFNAIRLGSPIARAQIAELTKLDRKSLTNFINEFLEEELVVELGNFPRDGMGRPFTMLEFAKRLVMGIEITEGCVNGLMMDLYGRIHASHRVEDVRMNNDQKRLLDAVDTVYRRLKETGEVYHGIGVAIQGVVDPARGIVRGAVNIPAAVMDLRTALEKFISERLFFEGCSNTAALAEKWFGCGGGADDFVYVELGTGVGAGIVSGRRIYHGAGMYAGELGHIVIEPGGASCRCGNKGCLEAYVSEHRILDEARKLLPTTKIDRLADIPEPERGSPLEGLLMDTGRRIGMGLATVINLLNPKLIVLGERVAQRFGGLLLPAIEEGAARNALSACLEDARFVVSSVDEPVAKGAAALVLSDIFEVDGHQYV